MRDPARIPAILEALRVEWEKMPDMRLGQLLGNAMSHGRSFEEIGRYLFQIEDDQLAAKTKWFMVRKGPAEGK